MAKETEITLTEQELSEIKDTIKFRTKIVLQLKRLNGLPDRVTKAETKLYVLMWGIPIILLLWGIFTQVLAK